VISLVCMLSVKGICLLPYSNISCRLRDSGFSWACVLMFFIGLVRWFEYILNNVGGILCWRGRFLCGCFLCGLVDWFLGMVVFVGVFSGGGWLGNSRDGIGTGIVNDVRGSGRGRGRGSGVGGGRGRGRGRGGGRGGRGRGGGKGGG
jgi:hypothetical protein